MNFSNIQLHEFKDVNNKNKMLYAVFMTPLGIKKVVCNRCNLKYPHKVIKKASNC